MRRRFFQTYKNSGENLTLVSLEDNNEIYLNVISTGVIGEIEMKVSGDSKWIPNDAIILNKGDFIEYRGTISSLRSEFDRIGTFMISKKVNLYGDCTSILKDRMLFNGSLAHLFEYTPVVNIHSTFLPATTLADRCYDHMFYGCTSLTTAPALPATTLADGCYNHMFYDCSKLNYIKMLATDISAFICLYNWVSGVSSAGTFVKDPNMTSLPRGSSGIPYSWTVVNDGED